VHEQVFATFCSLNLDPMTFIYELHPYLVEIYEMCKNALCMSMLLKVIVWQTYIHTDRQTDAVGIIYHAALWVVKNVTMY